MLWHVDRSPGERTVPRQRAKEAEEAELGLRVRGLASAPSYAAKRLTFLLFINKRLVECGPLRRAGEDAEVFYAALFTAPAEIHNSSYNTKTCIARTPSTHA
mgnify:CR=1 FL=1